MGSLIQSLRFFGKALRSKTALIYVLVYPGDENLGDVLISRLLVEALEERGDVVVLGPPSVRAHVLRRSTAIRLSKVWGLSSLLLLVMWRSLCGRETYQFRPPGHVFRGQKTFFGQVKTYAGAVYLRLLMAFGLRVCRVGTSVGPLGPSEFWLERHIYTKFHYYSVRDSFSLDYLQRAGISARLFPDLAWLLSPDVEQPLETRSKIILSFRDSCYASRDGMYRKELWDALWTNIHSMCRYLTGDLKKDLSIVYQVKEDKDFSDFIASKLQEEGFRVSGVHAASCEDDAALVYSQAYAVLSNRLHVLLLAYAHGALPVALIDRKVHFKIDSIFRDAGLESQIVDLAQDEPVSGEDLKVLFSSCILDPGKNEKFREFRAQIQDELRAIFGEGVRELRNS